MPLIKKIIRTTVREFSSSRHLALRSARISAPKEGVIRQPQTVEVYRYG